MRTPKLTLSARTDVGLRREHNEDNYLADPALGLFVVCDGMGGHAAGEIASAIAVRTVHEEVTAHAELLSDYTAGRLGAGKGSQKRVLNLLEAAVNRASTAIHHAAETDPTKRGMGTTLVMLLLAGNHAFIMHVGDSRLYLLRNGRLAQLTEDHTVHNELVNRRKFTREQALLIAPRNAITRAVGVYESCEPEPLVQEVAVGDRFLLCTDGLSEYFEPPLGNNDELLQALEEPNADTVTSGLIRTANDRGGKDNVTALVVTIDSLPRDDAAHAQQLEHRRQVLTQLPLFRSLDEQELRRILQVTDVRTFSPGDAVITQGETGDTLFVILNGSMDVFRDGVKLGPLHVGEHFGEMSLIRSQPRSASVIAAEPSELLVLQRVDFFELLRSYPRISVKLLWQFTAALADRMEELMAELALVREQKPRESFIGDDVFAPEDYDRKTLEVPFFHDPELDPSLEVGWHSSSYPGAPASSRRRGSND